MHKAVLNILQRVLVNYFYQVNAGFFLFWFFLLFGVVSGGQLISYHLSLIHGMIQSPVFLACVMIVWLLYTFKCVNYITRQLLEPRLQFLFAMNSLPRRKQFIYMLFVHVQVYMPVLVYACVVAVIAAREGYTGSMLAVLGFNIIMILLSAFIYLEYLHRKTIAVSLRRIPFSFQLPKPFFSLSLWFLWKERKQMLLVTKFFSLALLYGFIQLYEPDGPDIRPLLLILMLVAAAHSSIITQVRFFEEEYVCFIKNLPVSIPRRFIMQVFMYGCLMLPELLFMWKGYPVHFQLTDIPQVVLFSLSLPLFFHSILLMNNDTDTGSYYRIVFAACACLFFIILYNPGILLACFIWVLSFVLYRSHLFDFEKKEGNSSLRA